MTAFSKPNISVVKHLLIAFRCACHTNDPSDDEKPVPKGQAKTKPSEKQKSESFKYRIVSSTVFNSLVTFCIKNMDKLFYTLLAAPEAGQEAEGTPKKQKKKKCGGCFCIITYK
jgi:hypothetical protein